MGPVAPRTGADEPLQKMESWVAASAIPAMVTTYMAGGALRAVGNQRGMKEEMAALMIQVHSLTVHYSARSHPEWL